MQLCSEEIYQWLLGDKPMLEHILEHVTTPLPVPDEQTVSRTSSSVMPLPSGQTQFYYGNEGKREATRLP